MLVQVANQGQIKGVSIFGVMQRLIDTPKSEATAFTGVMDDVATSSPLVVPHMTFPC